MRTLQSSLEAKDRVLKEKDALNKKLKEIGKNFRDKYNGARKEIEDMKSSKEQVRV